MSFRSLAALVLSGVTVLAQDIVHLPGTKPLKYDGDDLSDWVMAGAHEFVERKIREATTNRARFWNFDRSSQEAFDKSIEPNRKRLMEILGVVDERLPARLERFGDDVRPALVNERPDYKVYQVRWDVLPGFSAEGLLLEPNAKATGNAILIPDADTTPEDILFALNTRDLNYQGVRDQLRRNVRLLMMTTVSRAKLPTEDKRLKRSDQTYREWIYRQAFQMGRHVIGYEMQAVLAAVDWFKLRYPDLEVGVAGHGEGGMIAFFSGAVDRRIYATHVSGFFGPTEEVWQEPIYRNVWGLHREFGMAEIKILYGKRRITANYGAFPIVTGHKGELTKPTLTAMTNEWNRIRAVEPYGEMFSHTKVEGAPVPILGGIHLFPVKSSPPRSLNRFPYVQEPSKQFAQPLAVMLGARHQRIFKGMETHVQNLVRQSEHVRDERFLMKVLPDLKNQRWSTLKTHRLQKADEFIAGAKAFRREFEEEAMGVFNEAPTVFHPRTRKIAETEKWTAYDVVLQVYPELIGWGALVLPKDLKPGEKRPVVVCQHGRNGVPLDTINRNKTAYNDFAAKLAERGFITFAPHNLYRGEDRYRWLDRKANTIKASLFSFIIAQHRQILKWLATQNYVDPERIAFYGLSYGGETAVRVPTIIEDYCLSICSGDFNQWTRKIAATDQPFSFMRTIEWEMPYWNLGHTFDYAEMAYLMVPRPFMVERGHHDRVGRDQWVAHEYAKVRWLYAQLGLVDRTEIEYFQGGHSINGQGTFDFLHKHLDWPKR